MFLWLLTLYGLIGLGLAILTFYKVEMYDSKDTFLTLTIWPLWPLWILTVIGFSIYEWRQDKVIEIKHKKRYFLRTLRDLDLVSWSTVDKIIEEHL